MTKFEKSQIALLDHIASCLFVIASTKATEHYDVKTREALLNVLKHSSEKLDEIAESEGL